jgi:ribonuclease E
MLINATAANELRIAIVEEGELSELDIEAAEQSSIRGNIYKGVVHNVEPSLEAAFIDFGSHKQGFLPFSEVSPSHHPKKSFDGAPRITDVLRRGQDIIVQVAKDAVGEKGATLTTYLSIPGRYSVLMPGSDAAGVSRKIDDDKMRKRIRAMAQKLTKPADCGFIMRTAGLGQTRAAIQRDLNNVAETWGKVQKSSEIARAPSLLYAEPDLIARTLRDYFSDEIDEVWIDTREEYEGARAYFEDIMPGAVERLKLYDNPIPIFAYHHVEEQIEATFHRRVPLPSGGSIVIDETEALVAVDVNSGKMTSEQGHEETVFKTNCEAAEEVARQLKLRDLGGIVVVDFIDMEMSKNRREIEKVMAEAARNDKARYKLSRIDSKGLLVLTRQRIRQGMRKAFQHRCEVCDGTGWRRTAESHSLSLVRRVETRLAQGGVGEVRVTTHRETAEYLVNQRRSELAALEKQYGCRIVVRARPDMDRGTDEVAFLSHGELLAEITDKLPPREERRGDRRRRKRSKKKKRRDRDPELDDDDLSSVDVEGDEGDAPPGDDEAQGGRRKKRSRKKKRKPKDGPQPEAPAQAEAPTADAGGAGPTFTGRPSPEVLARLRAERRARMDARRRPADEGAEPADSPSDEPPPMSGSPKEPRMEALRESAPEEPAPEPERRSLLDRIFGSR